jgi:hypothetical protein
MILLLGAASGGSTFQSEMPAFRPEEHKIVYYDFRKKQTPVAPRRTSPPQGERRAATARRPSPAKPLIRIPAPQIKPVETAQTTIARLNSSRPKLPIPPPPPKVDAPKAAQPNPSPPEPKAEPDRAPESKNEAVTIARRQAKAFVPPPPSPVKPRLETPVPMVLEENAPTVRGQSIAVQLAAGAGRRALSLGAAPALDAPPAPPAGNEAQGPDVLVASVNPGARVSLPGADQNAVASSTTKDGSASTGDAGKAGTRDSSGGAGEPRPKPPDVAPAMKAVLYSEKVRMGPPASLSVPLRPGARTLPRNIEARFQARNVFTIVVPIENFPGYGGDWILWFAEKQTGGPAAAAMRAPVPFRKMEPADQTVGERTAVRVMVAAVLAVDGKLGSISFLSAVAPGVEQAVVQDLLNWEFRPAARANVPAEVEIVLEIPYSLPVSVAKR